MRLPVPVTGCNSVAVAGDKLLMVVYPQSSLVFLLVLFRSITSQLHAKQRKSSPPHRPSHRKKGIAKATCDLLLYTLVYCLYTPIFTPAHKSANKSLKLTCEQSASFHGLLMGRRQLTSPLCFTKQPCHSTLIS